MHNTTNWFLELEEQKPLIVFALTLICGALILVSCLRNPADYDGWWHLQMGADLVKNGLSPFKDHYSFTYPGAEINGPPVAFQVVYFYLNHFLGEHGGQVAIKAIAFLTCLGLMLAWLRQISAPTVVYVIVLPLLVGVLQFRMQVRPEVFSYAFCIVAFMLYHRTKLRLGFKDMMPVALLMLVWSNYHSALFGYIIFFGLFLDIALRLFKEQAGPGSWMAWAGWGLLVTAVGFLNPSHSHAVLETLTFPAEWKTLIAEYLPPINQLRTPSLYPLIIALAFTLCLSVVQKRIGYIFITLLFAYSAATMTRMVAPALLISLVILAHVLTNSRIWAALPNWTAGRQRALGLFVFACVITSISLNVWGAKAFLNENQGSWALFPGPMVNYMQQQNLQGNVFNSYELGGYLLQRLSPHSKVFIDGRTQILYPVEHYLRYMEALGNTDAFLEEVEEYEINYAALPNSYITERLMWNAGFVLDFSDNRYSLYRRGMGNLGLLGLASIQPFCWPFEQEQGLDTELRFALGGGLAASAFIVPVAAVVAGYSSATNKQDFLNGFNVSILQTDASRRFFAFRALDSGLPELALNAFESLQKQQPKDELAIIMALIDANNLAQAHQRMKKTLDEMINWIDVEFIDLVIVRALIDKMLLVSDMDYLNPELEAELDAVVGEYALGKNGHALTASTFCAEKSLAYSQQP